MLKIILAVLVLAVIFAGGFYYFYSQQPSKTLELNPVTSEPKALFLQVTEPDDNLLTFTSEVLISGKTLPNIPVLISTQDDDFVVKSNGDGSFSTSLSLSSGVNEVQIAAFGNSGEQKSIEKTIYFSKEKI